MGGVEYRGNKHIVFYNPVLLVRRNQASVNGFARYFIK